MWNGEAEEVRQLLAAGADIEERAGPEAFTPLHVAAMLGHEGVVRLLLSKGADMSSVDNLGATPLHLSAHFEAAALLLVEHGADVSAKTNQGRTPEDFAMARSQSPSWVYGLGLGCGVRV